MKFLKMLSKPGADAIRNIAKINKDNQERTNRI